MWLIELHGLMSEYGVALPKGWVVMLKQAGELLTDYDRCPIPAILRPALLEQIEQVRTLTDQVKSLERQIGAWQRRAEDCQRIAAIPGVGLLTATAAVATIGDARSFRSGREFAAFLGLVPRQSGTGGRVKLLGISKRGDRYLRTLLIHGARTVLSWQRRPGRQIDPWLKRLTRAASAERRHRCVGQQNGSHDLGVIGPWHNVSKGLRSGTGLYRGVVKL
jgi:transposase